MPADRAMARKRLTLPKMPEQSQRLWQVPDAIGLKGKRDRALLGVLLACGLRRHEVVSLEFGHMQQREEHLAIIHMKGKRRPYKNGKAWGDGLTEKAVSHIGAGVRPEGWHRGVGASRP
jgi:site-specific recombinase XerD